MGPSSTDNLAGLYYPTASLLKEMPDEACKIIADAARRCPAAATLILTPCGGAAADVPKDATAVYHRDVKFWIVAAAGWKASTFRSEAAAREEAVAWARELRDALMPYTVGRYGMLGEDAAKEKWGDAADPDADPLVHASWGANYTKLQQIKAKYDPTNMFRLNHNVAPAAAAPAASPPKPKPRRSLSGRVLSALSPGKKK